MAVQAFKTVRTKPHPCSVVEEDFTVLQIFHMFRQPPREWFTDGWNLVIKIARNSDLTALSQPSNPMNRQQKLVFVHLSHIQAVLSKANSSLIFDPNSFLSDSKALFNLGVGKFMKRSKKREILIFTAFGGYSFLTCYSQESIIFEFYMTPFQAELWWALLATFVSLSLALSLWLFWRRFKTSFCPWMYVLGALLEDGVHIPEKLEKSLVFRLVFGGWIIVCVLLTNCYNGFMITWLNSPLQMGSVSAFKELVCHWQDEK